MSNKVFGIISYFPDPDTDYYVYARNQRIKRCSELLLKLSSLWPTVPVLIIAQNWQDYKPPTINNKITIYNYDRLGVLNARRELRHKFLGSEYQHLIMLDDDAVIECKEPKTFIDEIDDHPEGFGIVRHTNHSLSFAVISKSIYSQIDLMDIDIEKGEGFGDDLFTAKCFAKFPDRCYEISSARDLSIRPKYDCPSTWAADKSYDWEILASITEALMLSVTSDTGSGTLDELVDIVIPYVDAEDPAWQEDYTQSLGGSPAINRFRSWGSLRYLLRGVTAYMPFVRKIILIVAKASQIPSWLNTDIVRVVYHRDFIPTEYLPTFNSCTIESFLCNISDLSERFIYFNDDIFPVNPMVLSDFFRDGKPCLKFQEHQTYNPNLIFRLQSRSSLDAVTDMLGLDPYPQGEILIPEHSAFPMLKSSVDRIGTECRDVLRSSISKLREGKNINQYIYHYYQYLTGNYIDSFCPYLYMEIVDDLQTLRKIVSISEIKMVCLNDVATTKDYKTIRELLIDIFEEKFPKRCKYEKL